MGSKILVSLVFMMPGRPAAETAMRREMLKYKLQFLYFMECAIWGSYLTTLGAYLSHHMRLSGAEIGFIFSFIALSCILTLIPVGLLADRFISASRLYTICQIIGGVGLLLLSQTQDKIYVTLLIFIISFTYLPTLPLSNALMLHNCDKGGYDRSKEIPIIRVFGSIGFIASVWVVSYLNWSLSPKQFVFGAVCAFITAFVPFFIYKVPVHKNTERQNALEPFKQLFVFFKQRDVAVLFALAVPMGIIVQFSDLFASTYMLEQNFSHFAMVNSGSQISSIICGLALIYFLKEFNFKTVILISLACWILRNLCFAIGGDAPTYLGLALYGFAFEFFIVSSSLFIYQTVGEKLRSSGQAFFLMLFNGVGYLSGSFISGHVYDYFTAPGGREWGYIWLVYAALSLLTFLAFLTSFHFKGKIKPRAEILPNPKPAEDTPQQAAAV